MPSLIYSIQDEVPWSDVLKWLHATDPKYETVPTWREDIMYIYLERAEDLLAFFLKFGGENLIMGNR